MLWLWNHLEVLSAEDNSVLSGEPVNFEHKKAFSRFQTFDLVDSAFCTLFSLLCMTIFSARQPPPLHFPHSCIKLESVLASRCPLHPKTMCGVSFRLPSRQRKAPNKTKQLSLPLLGPGLPPLPLLNSPLPTPGPSLHSLLSVAVSVTISWTESLLSASWVERLADFILHVSFKGLSRSSGTGRLQHEGEGCPREKD